MKKTKPQVHIHDCEFTGVHWDAKSVEVIQTIADGLLRTATGLGRLTEVLRSQNVTIESLVQVQPK